MISLKDKQVKKEDIVSKKGLTLSTLMRSTTPERKVASGDVVIKSLKKGQTGKGKPVIFAKMSSATDPKKVYDTWITIVDGSTKRIPPDCRVHAQCSCYDFLYRWEYANAAHSAAKIFYGNGQPPDETNYVLSPGLCKHAYALAQHLLPNAR